MDSSNVPAEVSTDRRRFLGTAGAAVLAAGAAGFGVTGTAKADPDHATGGETGGLSFGPVRQINAGALSTGYVELGPADGQPVVLMHGFPYDIHSYVDAAPALAAEGYRVVVPYFRGYGTTAFLSSSAPRDVDQAAFALDILALMDALGIRQAILAGYDWGSRTGDIIAALWPQRVKALVSVTGYLITSLAAQQSPLPPATENDWWYQYYFATDRGKKVLAKYTAEIGQFIWKFNSPTWNFTDATYNQTAAAFTNRDYVPIVIGKYRWRLGLYPAEPKYAAIEAKLQATPPITVPTITIDGRYDPFTPTNGDGTSYRAMFTGKYDHRVFDVGHNVPQEAPRDFTQAVIDAGNL